MSTETTHCNIISESVFRANPSYLLTQFDDLPTTYKELLVDATRDPEFYGLLRPRDGLKLNLRSACRSTALLFQALEAPNKLPSSTKNQLGSQLNNEIGKLVLDGVLEIDDGRGFVSGPSAYSLFHDPLGSPKASGHLAELSIDALKYAQELGIDDIHSISARLYFFNRTPCTARWKKKLGTQHAVEEFLGIAPGKHRSLLNSIWTDQSSRFEWDGWYRWTNRREYQRNAGVDRTYKLYISPLCEFLPDIFATTVRTISQRHAYSFKVGCDVHGLLRPDKLLAYFRSFEDLQESALEIFNIMKGCPAHGVPFSSELYGNGLLSWGMDPPHREISMPWTQGLSWRIWLTNRLASALAAGKESASGTLEPWQYALARVHLDGVDTTSWTPSASIWSELI